MGITRLYPVKKADPTRKRRTADADEERSDVCEIVRVFIATALRRANDIRSAIEHARLQSKQGSLLDILLYSSQRPKTTLIWRRFVKHTRGGSLTQQWLKRSKATDQTWVFPPWQGLLRASIPWRMPSCVKLEASHVFLY